jgi:deazaflavin-dependent oxidoreductase (nitroreductase family)
MARQVRQLKSPGPLLRRALRLPIALYDVGLGRWLGQRFLLLHHTGAKTGLARRTLLEVVDHDVATDTYYVAAGFGVRSHWFRNLQTYPRARIEIAGRTIDVRARVLPKEQGAQCMLHYARKHPLAARVLAKILGVEVDGSEADYADLPRLGLHFVAFEPLTAPTSERPVDSRPL